MPRVWRARPKVDAVPPLEDGAKLSFYAKRLKKPAPAPAKPVAARPRLRSESSGDISTTLISSGQEHSPKPIIRRSYYDPAVRAREQVISVKPKASHKQLALCMQEEAVVEHLAEEAAADSVAEETGTAAEMLRVVEEAPVEELLAEEEAAAEPEPAAEETGAADTSASVEEIANQAEGSSSTTAFWPRLERPERWVDLMEEEDLLAWPAPTPAEPAPAKEKSTSSAQGAAVATPVKAENSWTEFRGAWGKKKKKQQKYQNYWDYQNYQYQNYEYQNYQYQNYQPKKMEWRKVQKPLTTVQ